MDNDMSQIRNLLEDKFNEVNVKFNEVNFKLSVITEALEIKVNMLCQEWSKPFWTYFFQLKKIIAVNTFNMFVTSKNETTNAPILQFTNLKCCIKAREPFETPF